MSIKLWSLDHADLLDSKLPPTQQAKVQRYAAGHEGSANAGVFDEGPEHFGVRLQLTTDKCSCDRLLQHGQGSRCCYWWPRLRCATVSDRSNLLEVETDLFGAHSDTLIL